jgi:hypothetical protein
VSSLNTPDVFFVTGLMLLTVAASDVFACPICFRVDENTTTDGARIAVIVLLGVTAVVLGAFGRFIVGFARRENSQIPPREDRP